MRSTSKTEPVIPGDLYTQWRHTNWEELNKYLHKRLAEGKIVHSKSPAGAPIPFLPKPDGPLRLCVDCRQLNKLTILNKYPLPLITEPRERKATATIFTKLDLEDS